MKEEYPGIPIYREVIDYVYEIYPTASFFPIKFKKEHPNAKTPRYAKPGDAGLDLFAVSIEKIKIMSNMIQVLLLKFPKDI